jgi:hypothetical protein
MKITRQPAIRPANGGPPIGLLHAAVIAGIPTSGSATAQKSTMSDRKRLANNSEIPGKKFVGGPNLSVCHNQPVFAHRAKVAATDRAKVTK